MQYIQHSSDLAFTTTAMINLYRNLLNITDSFYIPIIAVLIVYCKVISWICFKYNLLSKYQGNKF